MAGMETRRRIFPYTRVKEKLFVNFHYCPAVINVILFNYLKALDLYT